jgi:hypothetical protein
MLLLFVLTLLGSVVVYVGSGSAFLTAGFVFVMGAIVLYGCLDSSVNEGV